MNRFAIMSVAFSVALCWTACQESKDLNHPVSEAERYKKIGEEIPFETGMQWIAFYREKQAAHGRLSLLSTYQVPAENMRLMLQSTPALTGIAFHYGIDQDGIAHILLIPVDETLELWSSEASRMFIDSNTGNAITYGLAYEWAQNYKELYPQDIWFHFFGRDVFDQMFSLPYFQKVSIEPATNDTDLTPQLLLVVWDESADSSGRKKYSPGTVYDASNACPPCATK